MGTKAKILTVVALFVLAAAAVAAFLLLRPESAESYRTIVVTEVRGTVLVSNDKKQNVPAYEGMALYDGDRISVGEDARLTVTLDGDKYMMAEAGTKFRLEAAGKAGSEKTVIHLESGAALTRIQNALNENQSYVVETPNSVISVRGTVWLTSISPNAEGKPVTLCQVFGGLVEMAAAGEYRQIPGGSAASAAELLGCSEVGALDYGTLSEEILRILLSFIADGEKLDASREELEEYLHKHTYADNWSHDEQEHWHAAACAHTSERKDVEAHSFDEGVITTSATHLAEGVMTYLCKCSYAKTETIGKVTEHTWGDWEADGNDKHTRSCACGETGSEAHSWNTGEITAQPTHVAEGVKTYTCTVCTHTKTEPIAKLTEHTWGNWEADGNDNHTRSCACGETRQELHHFQEGAAWTDEAGAVVMRYTCIYCDHQTTFDTLHECENDWDNPVQYDSCHWYPCTTAGCPARVNYENHSYEQGVLNWPTHDQPGLMVAACYCGHVLPGSEAAVEFYNYFLDFSGCTTEGINQSDNMIYVGDAFDYENVRLIGYYEDTVLEYDENYHIIGYDYGRVLEAGEYTVCVYRVYSLDQKELLTELDLTVPGEYEICYLLPDGDYLEMFLTILAGTV